MLIVPTNISDSFVMADTATNVEDLEDGEIESDGENEAVDEKQADIKSEDNVSNLPDKSSREKSEPRENYSSKSGRKKKSKSNKGEQKSKDKTKKSRRYDNPMEDDFAGSIEKAIRKAMKKKEGDDNIHSDDEEDRRRNKKRKKHDGKEGGSKKRKKQEYSDEMDESEMMCVRGASPLQKDSHDDDYHEEDKDSYASDSSHGSRDNNQHHRSQKNRQSQRDRNKNDRNKNDRRRNAHPMQDPEGVCMYYMQGKCHKGDDCIYSHDAQPPRKMELCKFYLMDCCAKRDKCLYMHADFPCKFYHTGLPCIYKDECKFAHGKPLSEAIKNILLKHIESAPKEILGEFPRLNREGAIKMIQTTQAKLIQQFPDSAEAQEKSIPSLFELNIPHPQGPESSHVNQYSNDRQKFSPKVRQSRWQNDNSNNMNFNTNMSPNNNSSTTGTLNVLSIKNLTGVLTPRQISDFSKMGIENLEQLGQLTVLQLNGIGLSLKQITEIQLNTMSIQKLGLINASNEIPQQQFPSTTAKDMDLRVPPIIPVSNNAKIPTDFPGQDVDMRFQPSSSLPVSEDISDKTINEKESQPTKDMIDIDQYTKDALKFASKDKENIDVSNETYDNEKSIISNETKDVDHRVLHFSDEAPRVLYPADEENIIKKECDTDIRFLQPEPLFKNSEKRTRLSTTDDEDNNLLIDEKWYSSDEEKGSRKKTPVSSPRDGVRSPEQPKPHVIEPSAVLSRLGDLSKIDISEEVTKLLNTMKNNLHDAKSDETSECIGSPKLRDPRSKRSPDTMSDTVEKSHPKKKSKISIYDCTDDDDSTGGRRRLDVDLRKTDFNVTTFGDTDLRQSSSGDVDFRLGLPFKAISNYTPASEINASINCHPPIPYKVVEVFIPRPDYTDIKNTTAKSQALTDPRLRKVFRLSTDESNSDSEKSVKPVSTGPRIDPRRKPKESVESIETKSNTLDLQTILLNSNWYKELSSTQKIFVNQHLAPVTQMIKQYQQEKPLGKQFDIASIQSNTILGSIFTNLGITLSDTGEYSYLPKPKEALLKTPVNINQNNIPFALNPNLPPGIPGGMDGNNMNMMNMPAMGMGMNNMNMHGFNNPMGDPRGGPTPGLLGIAPNMPHNYKNNAFGGPNNFGNMPFNGPGPGPGHGNDFNFMEGEQNFPRFPNRGGHRGRGNDRWNRGNPGRGNRDRKKFNDRGSWKNDRN